MLSRNRFDEVYSSIIRNERLALEQSESYGTADIEQKDWDRAAKLWKSGNRWNEAKSMCKLTKNPRKIWARAACLYAIQKKVAEVNAAVKEARNACTASGLSCDGIDYAIEIKDYEIDSLTDNFKEVRGSAKLVRLEDIPFASTALEELNAQKAAAEAAVPKAAAALDEKKNRKKALQDQLDALKQKIGDEATKKEYIYRICFNGNRWTIMKRRRRSEEVRGLPADISGSS